MILFMIRLKMDSVIRVWVISSNLQDASVSAPDRQSQ